MLLRFLAYTLLLAPVHAAELLTGTRLPNQTAAASVDGTIAANSVAYGRDGSLYVSGTNQTLISVPHQGTSFRWTAWVRKLSRDGKQQAYFSFLPDGTVATALAVSPDGSVFVTGGVSGSDLSATPGVYQTDGGPGFLAKLDPSGALAFIARISANPSAVAVDAAGFAYVAGTAGADFRTTPGSLKAEIGEARCANRTQSYPCSDAFVMKVSPDGRLLVYATYVGGTGTDRATAIAVDGAGSAYLAGETLSADFPVTANAFDCAYGGTLSLDPQVQFGDAFAAKINPAGKSLVYATYLGGTGVDIATGIAVDASGYAVVTGTTQSNDFPVTADALQPTFGGSPSPLPAYFGDVFVVKLSPQGAGVYSSYLGGKGRESGGRVAFGPGGDVFLTANGPLIAALEDRQPGACESGTALIRMSRNTLTWTPVYGVSGTATLATGAGSLVAISGADASDNSPFSITAGALDSTGSGHLAVFDSDRPYKPSLACLVNAASLRQGRQFSAPVAIAPGEIFTLMGNGLGPVDGVVGKTVGGAFPIELAGTVVKVGGVPAALLYVSDRQINAMAPYSLTYGTAPVWVERNGAMIGPYDVDVARTVPGIFTTAGSGVGQIAAVNQDGSLNSTANPAERGSIVSMFMTGFGAMNPNPADSSVTPLNGPWASVAGHFDAYIQGSVEGGAAGMEVLYAGPAPGQAAGLVQVNVRIPQTASSGTPLVRFAFDQNSGFERTQDYVYLAVK